MNKDPSINFLELYALAIDIFLWAPELQNQRVIVFCNNETVVYNLKKASLTGENSMMLLWVITLISTTSGFHQAHFRKKKFIPRSPL